MSSGQRRGSIVDAVVRRAGVGDVIERLSALPLADLVTVLLAITKTKAGDVSPAEVLQAYESSRFVRPAERPPQAMLRTVQSLFDTLPEGFEAVTPAPLLPLAAHSAVATVDQHKVVATVRGTEVAADPTNALALEAAVRRRQLLRADPRSVTPVRLAASQRVVRAQYVSGPHLFAHFELFGLVTAARDTGSLAFERSAAAEHVRFAVRGCLAAGADAVEVALSDFRDGAMAAVSQSVRDRLASDDRVRVTDDPHREGGRGYYDGWCFTASAVFGDQSLEIADGGFVNWTQRLVASAKERLIISGLGVDRLVEGLR